jgi:Hint domain
MNGRRPSFPAVAPLVMLLAVTLAACTVAASPGPSGGASPGGSPSPAGSGSPVPGASASSGTSAASVTSAIARYHLIDAVGQPFFCDPDLYPVARGDQATAAAQHLPAIRADVPTYEAIAARLGLDPSAVLDQAQQVAVYDQWKVLQAIALVPSTAGWTFDVAVADAGQSRSGQRFAGTIARDGTVAVTSRTPAGILTCPICLARGTRISTPAGPVAVEALRPGDPVWTFDAGGHRIVGLVTAVGSTPVPPTHRVVRLVLSDGRTLEASPGHPLLDGRPLGTIRAGDMVDGAAVVSAVLVPYAGGATFDLLASGPTGGYIADGIPMRSTIGR